MADRRRAVHRPRLLAGAGFQAHRQSRFSRPFSFTASVHNPPQRPYTRFTVHTTPHARHGPLRAAPGTCRRRSAPGDHVGAADCFGRCRSVWLICWAAMVLGCGRMHTPRACVRYPAPVIHQAKDTGTESVPGTVPHLFAHARASSTLRGGGGPGAEIDPHDQVRCERPQGPRPQGTAGGRRPLHAGPPRGLALPQRAHGAVPARGPVRAQHARGADRGRVFPGTA